MLTQARPPRAQTREQVRSTVRQASTHNEVIELLLEAEPGEVIRWNMQALLSALAIRDPTRVVVDTDGGNHAVVTIYPTNPLATVRAVTREDLTMDRHGRIVIGVHHDGRPARRRLYDPTTGSAQRFLLFGTTGAGKSRALQLQLIAEKINGICTALADLKEGQSVPEARDNVAFHTSSQEGAILMLRSAVAVAHARMRRYAAAGRTSFWLGAGDPLFNVHLDEVNRLLERGAPYRDEGTYLIKELGRTGRSVGVGIDLAAQASHLEELGGSDTLRAMLKEGEITLLRWSSSMMRQLVSDGLLPADVQLAPITKQIRMRAIDLIDPYAWLDYDDEEEAPGTQGMGYVLSGPRPTSLMRHLRCGSIVPLRGLDPEILALYGDEEPVGLEQESWEAAGPAYAARHDPEAFEALCQQLREEYSGSTANAPSAGSSTSAGQPRRSAKPRLSDRILVVLEGAEEPMTADDVLAAVLEDGGKPVKIGTVRNELGGLADRGDVARMGRGLYTLA
ncbi:hypothetical protein AB0F88_40350 [Streptosporangium sp. NPDC023963]|uniref:hypothetical protein n=1 Tax=Streptosporangium sp. NPDC023963 TaxID=3155608 RepID=UPI00342E908A